MKALSALAVGILVLTLPTEAWALKSLHEVTSSSPDLRVTAQRNEDGTVTVAIVRDTKAARYQTRTARLRVGGLEPTDLDRAITAEPGKTDRPGGAGKPLVECKVDAFKAEDKATAAIPPPETSDNRWSEAVDGLQARLSLVEKDPLHGHRWLVPYLELRNVRDLLNAMEVDCSNSRLKVELVDKDGKPLRSGQVKRSGPHPELGTMTLPFESSMRISLECRNWGMGGAAMVATDCGAWHLAEEENGKVFLRATLTGDKSNPEWKTWHGELQTPLIPVIWGVVGQSNDSTAVLDK